MMRELPKVDFGGTQFFIDLRLNEFREVDDPMNSISFDHLQDNETEDGFVICFDPNTKNAFEGTKEEFEQRKDLKIVQLPGLKKMDPVGFKQKVGETLLPKKRKSNNKGLHL